DREAVGALASYKITVRATSADTSTITQDFVINVTDIDEFHINSVKDSDPAPNEILENSVGGKLVGITAHAYEFQMNPPPHGTSNDPDATEVITYTLINNGGGKFQIDSATGVVSVRPGAVIDRETDASFTITVLAQSSDGSSGTGSFVINVLDVDEFDVSS